MTRVLVITFSQGQFVDAQVNIHKAYCIIYISRPTAMVEGLVRLR